MFKKNIFVIIFFLFWSIFFSCNLFTKPKIMVYFSSYKKSKIESKIVNYIINSKKEILLAAYNLSSKKIINSLINVYKKGVKMKILLDGKNIRNKIYILKKMIHLNIPIKINFNYNIMHNKFLIIDSKSVETGSYNYTFSANNFNAENIIYLNCMPNIANKYKKEFLRLWNISLYLKKFFYSV